MTYADTDNSSEVELVSWTIDASNKIVNRIATNSTKIGDPFFDQVSAGDSRFVTGADDTYSPGILVPFNAASRNGSNFLNGANEGIVLTVNTGVKSLPDLSATNLLLGFDYNGTIRTFRVWSQDITDAGLEEAT